MAHSVAMGTLVTRSKRRANKENDDSIEATEWKAMISELYGELQAVVAESGLRYFETIADIVATGAAAYSLPTDHHATIGINFLVNSAGVLRPLRELMVQERASRAGRTGEAFEYEISGTSIVFYPNPASGTYKHVYVPQPTDVSAYADGTSIDLVSVFGEKFVIFGAAALAKNKSESDLQFVMVERDKARAELSSWACLRAFNNPRRVIALDDDYGEFPFDPGDWRYGR